MQSPFTSWAQKKTAKAAPPAGIPVLAFSTPLGVQPGATTTVTLAGQNLASPTGVWVGIPGKSTLDSNKIQIEVPAQAPLGVYGMRLATKAGLSNPRVLCVDELPIVAEKGDNRKGSPQELKTPCVVDGRTDADVGDFYKIKATAGQSLSFEILGRRIGSPLDAHLTLYQAATMRELAHDNDSPGCQGDARLRYTFKEAGDYLVEVRDVLNRGGADYAYRLRIGDFPLATTPVPMAARRGSSVKLRFAGPDADGIDEQDVKAPREPGVDVVMVTPRRPNGVAGWPVALYVTDMEELVEREPNNSIEKAQQLPALPCGVTGRFETSDDLDVYAFNAKKGEKIAVEAQTVEWGSPSLVYLSIKNAKTKAEVGKSTPQAPPPGDQRVEFTVPEDGVYLIEVQHLYYVGGKAETYHLTVQPVAPTFSLTLSLDKTEMSPDGLGVIPFQIVRKGFTGPLEVSVAEGSAFKGVAKVKANQTAGVLLVSPSQNVELGAHGLTVKATAQIDGKAFVTYGIAKAPYSAALGGLLFPTPTLLSQIGVAVKEKARFELSVKLDPPDAAPGTPVSVTVSVKRDADVTEDITINPPQGLPATIPAPKIPTIAKGKSETKFTIDVNAKTAVGDYFVLINAKTKVAGTDVTSDLVAIPLAVGAPFDLTLEPMNIDLIAGGKTKVKVKATRKANYKGPIGIELRNLPAKVTATKGTIAAEQQSTDIELSAAPDAPPVAKAEIDAQGTATALANLQGTSPSVVLKVQTKK
jgi:hypothetical protein